MKKNKFLKEKMIYAIITIVIFDISFISISYAFTGKTLLTGANVEKDVPVINYNDTGTFTINGDPINTRSIEVLLNGRNNYNTLCTYDLYFVFDNVANSYVSTEENSIFIIGKDKDYVFLRHKLLDSTDGEEFIGAYQIKTPKGGNASQSLTFDLTYDNLNNEDKTYSGHIEIRNVLCIKTK